MKLDLIFALAFAPLVFEGPLLGQRESTSGPRQELVQSIESNQLGAAFERLGRLLEETPLDASLLRAKFHLSLATGDVDSALEAAGFLDVVDSDRVTRASRKCLIQAMSRRVEVGDGVSPLKPLDALDRVQALRERGDPGPIEPLLVSLHESLPDDPAILYLMGEYYGSDHDGFDQDRAVTSFQAFLASLNRMTEADRTGDEWSRFDVLLDMLGSHTGDSVRQLRVQVYGYLVELESGKKLGRIIDSTRRRMDGERETTAFQDLEERVLVYRELRQPKEMLPLLRQMEEMQPDNPAVQFCLGEVCCSVGGSYFARDEAIRAFERFLALTSNQALEEGRRLDGQYGSHDVSRDVRRMLGVGNPSELDQVRLEVQRYLVVLRSGEDLYLMSPARVVRREIHRVQRELDKSLNETASCERRLESAQDMLQDRMRRPVGTPSRGADISSLRSQIDRLENEIRRGKKHEADLASQVANLEALIHGS